LYRPPIARDTVVRNRLLKAVAEGVVTLVSAPAGYGKSTLVSQWLNESTVPSAWLSLDPADSDLRQFLAYVSAAVRTIFPDACREILDCLQMVQLPSPEELAGVLGNDLDQVDRRFILVLDDYYRLRHTQIHDLIDGLLHHPPRTLHLVIVTRRDPPLELQALRARGTLTEIRMRDLAFSAAESAAFARNCLGDELSETALSQLHQVTEGWPVALRLATLAVPETGSMGTFVQQIPGEIRQVREYLLKEVLAKQPPKVRAYLLRTAYLDRFNAALCDVVSDPTATEPSTSAPAMTGEEFLDHIRDADLLCIALDGNQEWFRYHHLFQSMLQAEAHPEIDETVIRDIHLRASKWFEEHGYLEEAVHHTLAGDGPSGAGALILRHRNEIMNFEQWSRLDSWFRSLPAEMIAESPELLVLKAHFLHNRGQREDSWQLLDKVEALLDASPVEPRKHRELIGSVESLRCYQHYAHSRGTLAADSARYALTQLPPDSLAERGFAMILLGAALQMTGELELAKRTVYDAMTESCTDDTSGTYRSRLFVSLCFIQWMNADLPGLELTSREITESDEQAVLGETHTLASFFQAAVHYHENKLADAESALQTVLLHKSVANENFFAQCTYIAALVYQERNRPEEASNMARFALEYALKHRNKPMVLLSEAFKAELAIRQGRMSEALEWARHYDPEPFTPMYHFYSPRMTLVKLLVLEGSEASRSRAGKLLDKLAEYLAQVHNKRFLIETLAIRSMLLEAQGDRDAAIQDLTTAISEALPGRCIRLFVDLGPRLASLLSSLDLDEEHLIYVGEILAACRETKFSAGTHSDSAATAFSAKPLEIDPLSKREQEILLLLAERLSNKEIADSLHISIVTVKRHAANIYQKLAVHGRRQAVAKATGLGLLQRSD